MRSDRQPPTELARMGGHKLLGKFGRGRWSFICASYPDLEQRFAGARESGPCITEFMRRCLVGGVPARRLRGK